MLRAVDILKQAFFLFFVLKKSFLIFKKEKCCNLGRTRCCIAPISPPSTPPHPPPPPPTRPLTATSLNRALSSVLKMTVVEMFGCNLNNNLSPLQVDAVYSKSGLASIYQGCEVKGFRYRRIRNGCLYLQQCLLFVICFRVF